MSIFGRSLADGDRLDVAGATVRLKVHARARRISLRLDRTKREIIATAPSQRRLPEAAAFARDRASWIAERLAELPQSQAIAPGMTISLFGQLKRDNRPGSQRARDFLDIHVLVESLRLDMLSPKAIDITRQMFALKRVKLDWLGNIENYREFHRQGFPSVKDTVSRNFDLQEFDFYVDYVVKLANDILTEVHATPA